MRWYIRKGSLRFLGNASGLGILISLTRNIFILTPVRRMSGDTEVMAFRGLEENMETMIFIFSFIYMAFSKNRGTPIYTPKKL